MVSTRGAWYVSKVYSVMSLVWLKCCVAIRGDDARTVGVVFTTNDDVCGVGEFEPPC